MFTGYLKTEEETRNFAKDFAKTLEKGSIILLYGDLGAGKTTFVRGLVEGIESDSLELVSSPTFQFLNIYDGKIPVYHFDLYRLKSSEDFLGMGFDELLFSDAIACIEWAERISDLQMLNPISITLSHEESGVRKIIIKRT